MTRHGSSLLRLGPGLALVVSLVTPAWAGHKFSFELETIRRDSPKRVLEIHNANGLVRLMPSNDGSVRVAGEKIIEASSRERALHLAERVLFRVREGRDVLRIEVDVPEGLGGRGFFHGLLGRREGVEVELRVHVPAECRLRVRTMTASVEGRGLSGPLEVETLSGDVDLYNIRNHVMASTITGDFRIENAAGNVRIETASGDIRLRKVEGRVDVDTASGDVDVSDIGGDVVIQTLSGDLSLGRCSGSLRFATASGQGQIENIQGNVEIQSASGDLDLESPLFPNNEYDFETASGDIGVRVQGHHPFHVDAFTARGDLVARLPGLHCESRTERELVGRIGQGGANLRIRSASGSIRLWASEAKSPPR